VPIDLLPQKFLTSNGVAVVPYDTDVSGISYRRGRNAHWCVVWKIWSIADENLTLLTHSSAILPSVERWSELLESNKQLEYGILRLNSDWADLIDAKGLRNQSVWIDI
jgi:hypothetical protein